jgi:hypothetical protein
MLFAPWPAFISSTTRVANLLYCGPRPWGEQLRKCLEGPAQEKAEGKKIEKPKERALSNVNMDARQSVEMERVAPNARRGHMVSGCYRERAS